MTLSSVRLRLIDRLESVIDHVAKHLVQKLRGAKVHAKPAHNINEAFIPSLVYASPKGYGYDAASLSRFEDAIHEFNSRAIVSDFQPCIANREFAPASYNNILSHQPSPFGKNYLDSLIPKQAEVEGRG